MKYRMQKKKEKNRLDSADIFKIFKVKTTHLSHQLIKETNKRKCFMFLKEFTK
jgi:hypothetical protein